MQIHDCTNSDPKQSNNSAPRRMSSWEYIILGKI